MGLMEVLPRGCVHMGKWELLLTGPVGLIRYFGDIVLINWQCYRTAVIMMANVGDAQNVDLPHGHVERQWGSATFQETHLLPGSPVPFTLVYSTFSSILQPKTKLFT